MSRHIGFDRLELTEKTQPNSHAHGHYLYRKYFDVNDGGDGLLPSGRCFGNSHDGSKVREALTQARYEAKKARMNAKRAR